MELLLCHPTANRCILGVRMKSRLVSGWSIIWTFTSEDEDDYEYEFSVLDMRIRFGGRHFSKCACSERKKSTRSHPRPPI